MFSKSTASSAVPSLVHPIRARYMQTYSAASASVKAVSITTVSQLLTRPAQTSDAEPHAKKAKLIELSFVKPQYYSFLTFLNKVQKYSYHVWEQSLLRKMDYLKSLMTLEAPGTDFKCYIQFGAVFLYLELSPHSPIANNYQLSIFENGTSKASFIMYIRLEQEQAITVIKLRPSRLKENDVMCLIDGINLLFNFPVTFNDKKASEVVRRTGLFNQEDFAKYLTEQTISTTMSRRALQIFNASYIKNDAYIFHLSWKNIYQADVSLTCKFQLKPYVYWDVEEGEEESDDNAIQSWVFDEKHTLLDYKKDAGYTISSYDSTKHKKVLTQYQYYWLQVFVNDFELLKIWVSLDGRIGELRDLHAPDKKYGLNGLTILKIYDYLQDHFLKSTRTYLCDGSGISYAINSNEKKSDSNTGTIPYRIIYPLVYGGHSYYSKYLPGFEPISCQNIFNSDFQETISSNPDAFKLAASMLTDMPLIQLFYDFDKLRSEKELNMQDIEIVDPEMRDVVRNVLIESEVKKNDILFDLVNKYFPKTVTPEQSAQLALPLHQNTFYLQYLKTITLGCLVKKIWENSKQCAPHLHVDLLSLNQLLEFRDGSLSYDSKEIKYYPEEGYYGLLKTLLANGRYWVRLKKDELPSSTYQPTFFQSAAAAAASSTTHELSDVKGYSNVS